MYCDKDNFNDIEIQSWDMVCWSIILGGKSLVVHVHWWRKGWWVEGLCMEAFLKISLLMETSWPLLAISSSAWLAMLPWVGRGHWPVFPMERRTRRSIVLVLIIVWVVVRVCEMAMVMTVQMVVVAGVPSPLVELLLLPHPPP